MANTQKATAVKVDFPTFFDFTKLAEQFKVPAVDTSALIEFQRKNIEAFSAANRVAFEGAQAVVQRQAELVRKSFEDATTLATNGKPEDVMANQADFVKKGFEQAVANGREILELSAKSNGEAAEVLNQRVVESLDEVTTAMKGFSNGK